MYGPLLFTTVDISTNHPTQVKPVCRHPSIQANKVNQTHRAVVSWTVTSEVIDGSSCRPISEEEIFNGSVIKTTEPSRFHLLYTELSGIFKSHNSQPGRMSPLCPRIKLIRHFVSSFHPHSASFLRHIVVESCEVSIAQPSKINLRCTMITCPSISRHSILESSGNQFRNIYACEEVIK